MQQALLGGGCFWCIEAVFRELKGVQSVENGYAGGATTNPNYEAVCLGTTGHAEVIKVVFDENVISYHDLLTVFFGMHDPTTLNRQGNDIGTQYRSVIFYYDEEQEVEATQYIEALKADNLNIVTQLKPAPTFYVAEDYHQNFYEKNPNQGYCNFAIPPKLLKLRNKFTSLMK